MDDSVESGGGEGGFCTLRKYEQVEAIRMNGRAAREEWPVPDADRPQIYAAMRDIALGSDNDKCRVGAAAVITRMVGQNQANEHKAADLAAGATNTILGSLAPEQITEIATRLKMIGSDDAGDNPRDI